MGPFSHLFQNLQCNILKFLYMLFAHSPNGTPLKLIYFNKYTQKCIKELINHTKNHFPMRLGKEHEHVLTSSYYPNSSNAFCLLFNVNYLLRVQFKTPVNIMMRLKGYSNAT